MSGAVPPPAARPLEREARVPRPVCPGCGRCGRWDPAPAPQRAPLRAGVARRGGGGRASPGGAFHRCEGRLVSGAVPPPAARPLERAAGVPRPVCPGCGRCVRGDPAPAPQRALLRAGVARCGGGGRTSPGGSPSTIVRGAWCQALSLPRPFILWSGQPGFRVPCVPGAVGAGVGTQHRSHSVRPCGPGLLAVGVAEGRPLGGCFPPLGGAPGVKRCPSPGRPSSGADSQGSASRVSRVRSVQAWGPSTGLTACALVGRRCSLWGWQKGVPGGGVLSTVVRGARCQALSLPWPPVLCSGQPGFRVPCVPGAVRAGVGTRHRPHSVRPCGPALPAVGVAEERPRGGRLPPL